MLPGLKVLMAMAGIISVLVGIIKVQSCRQEKLKAEKAVLESTVEVQREQEKRKAEVERMAPGGLLDYWRGLHDGAGSGAASPAGKAKPEKP